MKFQIALKPTKLKVILTILTMPILWYLLFKIGIWTGMFTVETLCTSSIPSQCGNSYKGDEWIILPVLFLSISFYFIYSIIQFYKFIDK